MSEPVELKDLRGTCLPDRWKEGLPPPPSQVGHTLIQECSIPRQPAKPWDRSSDGDDSDEGVDHGEKICEDSDSTMETESECPTEIYVPGPAEKKPSVRGGGATSRHRLVGEVLPSILSHRSCGLRHTGSAASGSSPVLVTAAVSARGRLIDAATATAASEEAAMNIDSGISNETGGENATATSADGGGCATVRLRRATSDGDTTSAGSSRYSSSYSCGSRGDAHPPVTLGEGIRERELLAYMKQQKRLRIASVMSGCYGLLLLVLSIVLTAMTNHSSGDVQDTKEVSANTLVQAYYMYLYAMSLIFLVYAYAYALRNRTARQQRPHRRQKSAAARTSAVLKPSLSWQPASDSKLHPTVGSLFLRICAAAFCICCMVDNGISFGVKVSSLCTPLLEALHPVAQLIFAFMQMYFIFVNSQMRLRRQVVLAKFGIMHMAVTNISVWVYRFLDDGYLGGGGDGGGGGGAAAAAASAAGTNGLHQGIPTVSLHEVNSEPEIASPEPVPTCSSNQVLRNLLDSTQPYLTPLTIQYCFVTSSILCALWASLGGSSPAETGSGITPCSECTERSLRRRMRGTRTIDCRRTGLGLCAGVVLLAAALAALVAHHTLRRVEPDDAATAGSGTADVLLSSYWVASYCLMLVVAVAMLLKLRSLDYNGCRSTGLEDTVLAIGTAAVLARNVHSMATIIVASQGSGSSSPSLITLAAGAFDLLQSVVQSAAVALALRLHCRDHDDAETKPGRQCVAFLLVANVALWATQAFGSIAPAPQYGLERALAQAWTRQFLTLVVEPAALSYRLVAAACLTDVWHDLYRSPRADAV